MPRRSKPEAGRAALIVPIATVTSLAQHHRPTRSRIPAHSQCSRNRGGARGAYLLVAGRGAVGGYAVAELLTARVSAAENRVVDLPSP